MKNYSLIGMSNVGKSFWREKLEARGFRSFWCDYKIEKRLGAYLKKEGYRGIEDVAKWMGQPYEERYKAHQAIYLKQEIEVMQEALSALGEEEGGLIVDTTGSVVYSGEEIMERLRKLSVIVLLDTPESIMNELYLNYLAKPKPVIWGKAYIPLPGESPTETLARCYPILLQNRNLLYRRYADIVLDYHELRSPEFITQDFIGKIGAI
jgi:hypothetical protein